jgi:pimeloyl-ACP methyl ester carboxylesterase
MNAPGIAPSSECSLVCPAAPAEEESIGRVLKRFDREATHGLVDTGRYRCRYHVWGEGPPLVFIPGLSSDGRSFALVMALLRHRVRCISYDLPIGHGDGARLDCYTHANLVADLFSLLDHLRLPRTELFGFSFGGTIALSALAEQPERVPRAILQGGFAYRRLAPAEVLLARLARHWWTELGRLPLRDRLLWRSHGGPFADQAPEAWQFFLERCRELPIAVLAERALLLHRFDYSAQLGNVRQPVLVISGDLDPLVNSDCTAILSRGLPNATHVELAGCGHYAAFTHPRVLAELITRFLLPLPCAT